VLDNKIISAPEIQGVLTGDSQISGSFTAQSADDLAGQLRYGALPLTFTAADQENLSPTLGAEYLRAGMIAAGIGLLLVAIYAFFYYRLLGTVIVLSLVLSAGLVFGALVFLGRQIGFTLTLAGIAGFIVSLGVAADSFVIYFERLKDEIRDGRSPRSAVPRAWARARRTIISANAISIMAAVVLYIVSVGTVKGFAFALGLATILDLVVVFLFRHPIMTMFANTKAFLSPRVSGLGRILEHDDDDGDDKPRNPRTRTPRAKEA
jgi:preprotein translocase subunit SecD